MIVFHNNNSVPKGCIDENFILGTNNEHRATNGYHDIADKINFSKHRKGKQLVEIFIFLILKNLQKSIKQLKRNENFKEIFFEYFHRNNGRYQNYIETCTL